MVPLSILATSSWFLLLLGPYCFCPLLCLSLHAWNVPLVSLIFLKRFLVFPILLFSSISLQCSLKKVWNHLNKACKRKLIRQVSLLGMLGLRSTLFKAISPQNAIYLISMLSPEATGIEFTTSSCYMYSYHQDEAEWHGDIRRKDQLVE